MVVILCGGKGCVGFVVLGIGFVLRISPTGQAYVVLRIAYCGWGARLSVVDGYWMLDG